MNDVALATDIIMNELDKHGLTVVPKEASKEMTYAAWKVKGSTDNHEDIAAMYKAMLEVAKNE